MLALVIAVVLGASKAKWWIAPIVGMIGFIIREDVAVVIRLERLGARSSTMTWSGCTVQPSRRALAAANRAPSRARSQNPTAPGASSHTLAAGSTTLR